MNLTNHIYRMRKYYATYTSNLKISVQMPSHITGEEDLLSPLPTTPCQSLFSL